MTTADPRRETIGVLILAVAAEFVFLVFSLYAVLLMAEFTGTNGEGKNLGWAVRHILTTSNFEIASISGIVGCLVLEYLRRHN